MFYGKNRDNDLFQSIINLGKVNSTIEKITDVMKLTNKHNLRSIIYACQKTVDLFNKFTKKYELTFLQNVFLGIVAYCLKGNQNQNIWWQTKMFTSTEFGINAYPMYKFSFDFIKYQYFNENDVEDMQTLFQIARKQEVANENLQILYTYYERPEAVVRQAISNLLVQLEDKDAISNTAYLQIVNYLISAKSILKNVEQVEQAKNVIYKNIESSIKNNESINLSQSGGVQLTEGESKEFDKYKKSIYELIENYSIKEEKGKIDIEKFCKHAHNNQSKYSINHSFMNSFNLEALIETLKTATSKEIYNIRGVFINVYNSMNAREFFSADLPKIKSLQVKLKDLKRFGNYDIIQKQQIKWFIDNLEGIIKKLQGDENM